MASLRFLSCSSEAFMPFSADPPWDDAMDAPWGAPSDESGPLCVTAPDSAANDRQALAGHVSEGHAPTVTRAQQRVCAQIDRDLAALQQRVPTQVRQAMAVEDTPPPTQGATRVQDELSFILHTWPWKETSLIVDAWSWRAGRVLLIAKGAKRPYSQLRGLLVPFRPLLLSWQGKEDTKVLHKAKWLGTMEPVDAEALMTAFYLNELTMRLTTRWEPMQPLFQAYVQTLAMLHGVDKSSQSVAVRRYERALLRHQGWDVTLRASARSTHCVVWQGQLVGLDCLEVPPDGLPCYPLADVQAFLDENYDKPAIRQMSLHIMRALLAYHLDGQPIHSKKVLDAVRAL